MPLVDLVYGEEKCRAHAEPVWDALLDDVRGLRVVRDPAAGFPVPARRTIADRAALVASRNDASAARRLGYRRIALLEHGIGQSYIGHSSGAYPGGSNRDMVGLFLSPNEHAASRDRAAYPAARVEVVGCPKLDTLSQREPDMNLDGSGPVVAISWHWSHTSPPEMRSALPHYRAALPALAERFHVIGHFHPMAARDVLPAYQKAGIEVVESFDEVLRRADVYVADNTSTLYEFASTGRPVVVLSAPWYRREAEHGLRFWEAADVGVNVWAPDDLAPAIDATLEARVPIPEGDALDVVYAYRTGAGQRAAAAVTDWLS